MTMMSNINLFKEEVYGIGLYLGEEK